MAVVTELFVAMVTVVAAVAVAVVVRVAVGVSVAVVVVGEVVGEVGVVGRGVDSEGGDVMGVGVGEWVFGRRMCSC